MKNYVVYFKEEPFFVRCTSEDEALNEATKRNQDVVAISWSDTPITTKIPQMRMGFAPEEDMRDSMGEENYQTLLEVDKLNLLEDKGSQDGTGSNK